jgi:hypothetical protein
MRRHCTGCFAALPAWPPPRCPRCRRATYTLLVRRLLTAWAAVGVLVGAAAIWLNFSKPDRKQAPAAKAATDAASVVRERLAQRPDAE